MATSFFLRTKETQGYTTLFVRLQSRKLGINYKLSTNLEVDIKAWQKAQESAQALQKFQAKEPKLWAKLDKLKQTLDTLLSGDEAPSKEKMRTIIDETVYADTEQIHGPAAEGHRQRQAPHGERHRIHRRQHPHHPHLRQAVPQIPADQKAGIRL